jgi:hypothetical protein
MTRDDRTEAIARWAFTAFVTIVVIGWILWGWLT